MSSIQRITGMNSGLDVDALVKASMTAYQNKIDRETQNQKILEYQQEQYKKIMKDSSDFYDKYFDILKTGNLFSTSTYQSVAFKSGDDTKVTAKGFAGADVSDYKVAVTQLASKATATFNKSDLTGIDKTKVFVKFGSKEASVDIIKADGEIDMSATAKKLNEELNKQGINVSAKYSEFSDSIILESGTIGESSKFNAVAASDSSNLSDSSNTYSGTNAKGIITKGTEIYNIDSKSNVITVDNVQFTLKAPSISASENLTHLNEGDSGTTTKTTTITTTASDDGKTTTTTTSKNGIANLAPLTEGDSGTTTTKVITNGTKTTTIASDGTTTTVLADGTTSTEHLTEGQNGATTKITTTLSDGTTTTKITTVSSDGATTDIRTVTTSGDGNTTTITTSSNGVINLQDGDSGTNTTTKTIKTITDGTTTTEITADGTTTIRKTTNPTIGKVTETIENGTETITNSYSAVSLSGSTDVTGMKDKIVSFINDYNTLLSSINTKIYEVRDRDYRPLTDEQKEAMTDEQIEKWEKKAQTGLLRKDSDLERIASAMKSAMSSLVSGSGLYLEKIGIKPVKDYAEKNGMYTIDESKLTQALEENAGNIKDLFTRAASDTDTKDKGGILTQLKAVINDEFKKSTSILSKKVGLDGTSTQYDNTLSKSISEKKQLVKQLNYKLSYRENALYNKYSALEKALQSLNSQQSSLTSMLGMN